MTKAEQIKNTLQETRQRRETQKPDVYEMKLQNLSKRKSEVLRKAFLEAKWLYNWLVSDTERLGIPANKVRAVEVKAGDSYEQRELTVLGSQIKQEIADRLKDNLRALGKLKENGHKVGALKHKRFVNSIPLKQYGVTYSLDFARNRVRIQKLGKFRVLGLHQIPLLAQAYKEWDNLELDKAPEHLAEVIRLVRQYGQEQGDFVLHDRLEQLERQLEALELLRGDLGALRVATRCRSQSTVAVLSRGEFVKALIGYVVL